MEFEEICQLEPRLLLLLQDAKKHRLLLYGEQSRERYWYGTLKPQMLRLVGWMSNHSDTRLHTRAAYDCAYKELYHALSGEWLGREKIMAVKHDN